MTDEQLIDAAIMAMLGIPPPELRADTNRARFLGQKLDELLKHPLTQQGLNAMRGRP